MYKKEIVLGKKYRVLSEEKRLPKDNWFMIQTPKNRSIGMSEIDYSFSLTAVDIAIAIARGEYEEVKEKVKRVYKCYEFARDLMVSDRWQYSKGDLVWNYGKDTLYNRDIDNGIYIRRPELDKEVMIEE